MKRFRFPLETLLTLRRRKLDKLEAELGALQRRRGALLDQAAELERRSAEARESVASAVRISGADLRRIDSASQAMLEQARAGRDAARRIDRDIAQARKAVIQARRDLEALANLREDALKQWRRDSEREEEALAAELYLARHRPGSGEA